MNLCELSGHRLEIFNVNLAHSFAKHHDVNSTDLISRRSSLRKTDKMESVVNGPFCVDRVKHALMSVGMNCPSERVLLFAPSFRKASRTSRCIRHTVFARYMPRVIFIPWILNSSCTENYLRKSALNWNMFSWSFVWKQDIGRFIVKWAKA